MTDEQRANCSTAQKGHPPYHTKPHTSEARVKVSAGMMGNTNCLGRHCSIETRARTSKVMMSNVNRLGYKEPPEIREKLSVAHWKGGSKVSHAKHQAKRRGLGYVYLNAPFVGCVGHHVDAEQVINMPAALHRSIWHRQSDGRGMAQINAIAYNFLFKQEVAAALAAKETP